MPWSNAIHRSSARTSSVVTRAMRTYPFLSRPVGVLPASYFYPDTTRRLPDGFPA